MARPADHLRLARPACCIDGAGPWMQRAVMRPAECVFPMMSPVAIAILSVSMSADAFAAAIGRGAQHRPTLPQALRSGLVFGVIEGLTPLIGFALGVAAADFVEAVDHWIAFGLLGAVGAKMIWEALKGGDDEAESEAGAGGKAASRGLIALVATAVGTSIDAGAIGVGLALLGENIGLIAASIGATTFLMATLGL